MESPLEIRHCDRDMITFTLLLAPSGLPLFHPGYHLTSYGHLRVSGSFLKLFERI